MFLGHYQPAPPLKLFPFVVSCKLIEGIKLGIEEGVVPGIRNIMTKFPHFTDKEIAELLDAPLRLVEKVRKEREL